MNARAPKLPATAITRYMSHKIVVMVILVAIYNEKQFFSPHLCEFPGQLFVIPLPSPLPLPLPLPLPFPLLNCDTSKFKALRKCIY